MSLTSLLLVPTNSRYSFTTDPAEQTAYVNPLTLNNLLIKYANAAVTITDKLIGFKKAKVELDIEVRETRQALEDMESDILQESEGSANDHKNLKAQAAFVRKRAKETGRYEDLKGLEKKLAELETGRLRKQVDVESAAHTLDIIDQLSQNVQTHLSYVKNEMKHTRNYS